MKPLTCRAARRRLQAFHDQELSISDQIRVAGHLEWCEECAAGLEELRLLRTTIRVMTRGRLPALADESMSLQRTVLSQVQAERDASFLARARHLFDDLHLVYAALGAAVATTVCLVIMLTMMRFATIGRPDSLAAIVNVLADPGSDANPVPLDARLLMPPALLDGTFSTVASSQSTSGDAVLTLSGVVTREGLIQNLALLSTTDRVARPSAPGEAELVEGLLDAASHARFDPARVAGLPVAVNMVWLVAHTTVHASRDFRDDLPVSGVRKRAVAYQLTGRAARPGLA